MADPDLILAFRFHVLIANRCGITLINYLATDICPDVWPWVQQAGADDRVGRAELMSVSGLFEHAHRNHKTVCVLAMLIGNGIGDTKIQENGAGDYFSAHLALDAANNLAAILRGAIAKLVAKDIWDQFNSENAVLLG